MRMLALAVLAFTLAACGQEAGDVATDSSADRSAANPMPTAAPVPPGPVRTANLVTVMDTGRPELCLGAVAESYPPQCGGPAIANWDWDVHGRDMFEKVGKVRWGSFAVTGTFDGTVFTATDAIAGALYDVAAADPRPTPAPGTTYSAAELEDIGEQLARELPGAQSAYGGEGTDGHVLVDVIYDDGTLQAWADREYGAGVVLVSSALVDVTS